MLYLSRLFSLLLLTLALVACAEAPPPPAAVEKVEKTSTTAPTSELPTEAAGESEPPAGAVPALPENQPFPESWTGDLDALAARRVIRVLTVYGVGRYYLDGIEARGLVQEVSRLFENFINRRLQHQRVRVHVLVIPVARDQLIPALLAGRGDIVMAGLSATPERQALVDFSAPVSKPLSEILVTGPSAPPLGSIDDLSGRTLYLRDSSSYRESVEALNQRFAKAGRAPVRIEPVSEMLEDEDLIEMVSAGLLPWAVVDDYKIPAWEGVFPDLAVRDDIVFRSGARVAWAIRRESPLLAAAANDFLRANREGTLVGNMLKHRYFRDFEWPANALAAEDFGRFKALEPSFRRYGERYGIDPLLLAAQGYQESRLDQRARSRSGAVGVMQLLPATAADPNVGIPDIRQADANIHAGVKYLDFLRRRYFSDPAIDDENRLLLALGAYNVGPRRMINLRTRAERLGYDPNVWFDNVELVAAREVGREPVQYVANIVKYHLSYRLSSAQRARHLRAREQAGI